MKAFQFSLSAVQTVRKRAEQQALAAYALALRARARAVEELKSCEFILGAAQREWQESSRRSCPAFEMARQSRHCQDLARKRAQCAASLRQTEQKAQACLQEMLQARQRREVVTKLRARQQLAYDRAVQRDEQKFLDEFAQRQPEHRAEAG